MLGSKVISPTPVYRYDTTLHLMNAALIQIVRHESSRALTQNSLQQPF